MIPVSPATGADETVIAPYPAALYEVEGRLTIVSRWQLTDEERAAVAAGEDLYLGLITDGKPVQPLYISVGGDLWQIDESTKYVCPSCHERFDTPDACKEHVRSSCGMKKMEEATDEVLKLL